MVCPNCGANTDEISFCGYCGKAMPPQSQPEPQLASDPWSQTPPQRRNVQSPELEVHKSSTPAVIAIIIVTLIIATFSWLAITTRGEDRPVTADNEISRQEAPGYWDYEMLLEKYFDLFEKDDPNGMISLLPPGMYIALCEVYDDSEELINYVDEWYYYWGETVLDYSIYAVYYQEPEDSHITELGFDFRDIERFVTVSVDVELSDSGFEYEEYFDLDLVRIDGRWYLTYVW